MHLATLLGTIAIEQNLELTKVRTRINDLMKEKGLCVVGTPELGSLTIQAQLPNVTSTNNSSTTSPVKNSPTNVSLPSTSFNSPAYVSSSSMTNKFVSNDWCFVDCLLNSSFVLFFTSNNSFFLLQLVRRNDSFESIVHRSTFIMWSTFAMKICTF